MTYDDLISVTLGRARRLKLVNPQTGQIDAADVELSIFNQLLLLVQRYDIDDYTIMNRQMFVTSPGVEAYPLPDDFGRWPVAQEEDGTGLRLDKGGSQKSDMIIRRPEEFERLRARNTGVPRYFCMAGRELRLDPVPDSNNGANYTGIGTYIQELAIGDLEQQRVPLLVAPVLEHAALMELGADFGSPQLQALAAQSNAATTALVNGQQRLYIRYRVKHTELGRRRHSGRY